MTTRLPSLLFAAVILATATPSLAGVSKVSSPKVTQGRTKLEHSATRYGDDRRSLNNKQSHSYELEYGLTEDIMIGLEGKSARNAGKGHEFTGYGAEMQYELTAQNDWWLDSAIKAKYIAAARSNSADEAEIKILLARSYGPAVATINTGFVREFGKNRSESALFESSTQVKYKLTQHLEPGMEWHAEFGKINKLGSEASHYIGPILTGALFQQGKHKIGYAAGYFWGLTGDSADNASRIQLGYEFLF